MLSHAKYITNASFRLYFFVQSSCRRVDLGCPSFKTQAGGCAYKRPTDGTSVPGPYDSLSPMNLLNLSGTPRRSMNQRCLAAALRCAALPLVLDLSRLRGGLAMFPRRMSSRRAKQTFAAMVLISVWLIIDLPSPAASPPTPQSRSGDYISPGFFNPPPGIRPINRIVPSRFRNARPSYAWRIHDGKRELIAFSTPIQHIVVIYMENRTPEDLFGAVYARINPSTGNTFAHDLDVVNPSSLSPPLIAEKLWAPHDPGHQHEDFVTDVATTPWPNPTSSQSGYAFVPLPPELDDITPTPYVQTYLMLIEKFGYANSVLQSNEGPSFEAHQYAIAGQSGGLSGSSIAPNGMADNPHPPQTRLPPGHGTCFTAATPPVQTVVAENMNSPYPFPDPVPPGFSPPPCNDYLTIFDVLQSAQPSPTPAAYTLWQYVAQDQVSIWSAPMAVEHLYSPYASSSPDTATQPFNVDPDAENWVLNITQSPSPLPSPMRPFAELTYLTPCLRESDHPNGTGHSADDNYGADNGPQWLAYVINAIEASRYWQNTAVIVTWDDWGGFYDNYTAAPWPYHPTNSPSPNAYNNPQDPNEWGFRVPLIVISPWVTSQGYISGPPPQISQGAILNFIENTLGLPTAALNGDDLNNNYGQNDLSDLFDFSMSRPTTLPTVLLPTLFSPANEATCPPAPTPDPSRALSALSDRNSPAQPLRQPLRKQVARDGWRSSVIVRGRPIP